MFSLDCIRQPSEVTVSSGCGNIFVYQFLDSTSALVVRLDVSKLSFTEECQTIYLDNVQDKASVTLEVAGSASDSIYFNYCNDVAYPNMGKPIVYFGKSGELYFSVSEDNPIKDPIWETSYYVTIEIKNLKLYDESNNLEMTIDRIVFWNVFVGWLPG